jgi:hypothetical protein
LWLCFTDDKPPPDFTTKSHDGRTLLVLHRAR